MNKMKDIHEGMNLGDYLSEDIQHSFKSSVRDFTYEKNSTGFNVWGDEDFITALSPEWLDDDAKIWATVWSKMEQWFEKGHKRGMAQKAHEIRRAIQIDENYGDTNHTATV